MTSPQDFTREDFRREDFRREDFRREDFRREDFRRKNVRNGYPTGANQGKRRTSNQPQNGQ